jgi:hypothetical protein
MYLYRLISLVFLTVPIHTFFFIYYNILAKNEVTTESNNKSKQKS